MTNKATVLLVGTIDPISKRPEGWIMDFHNDVPVIEILADGTVLHGGYTFDEMVQMQISAIRNNSRHPIDWSQP